MIEFLKEFCQAVKTEYREAKQAVSESNNPKNLDTDVQVIMDVLTPEQKQELLNKLKEQKDNEEVIVKTDNVDDINNKLDIEDKDFELTKKKVLFSFGISILKVFSYILLLLLTLFGLIFAYKLLRDGILTDGAIFTTIVSTLKEVVTILLLGH